MITFDPGGARGVRLKPNTPHTCAYADSFELYCNRCIVMLQYFNNNHHRFIGNLGSTLHRMAMKWFSMFG